MSDNTIEVRNLGKKYIINHQQKEQYTALRDVITNKVKSIGKKKIETGAQEEFWALKDVSFDIKQGDKVGIIGRNGAGKSTLLKLMSRITEPTTGSIKIKGRVASLLEVGTGFHPELTGRENIFLNGAILGMGKQEIKKKFDEIVEFAEVEKFLDTPVKRYSSGMYVRLAFSVAAHLEPEILIVDEVLAVGDAQFQKKCLGKMGDVSKEGRTVLFVSHNMGAIQQLCDKGILLDKGQIHGGITNIGDAVSCYLENKKNVGLLIERTDRKGDSRVIINKISIFQTNSNNYEAITSGQAISIQLHYENKTGHRLNDIEVVAGIYDSSGRVISFFENKVVNTILNAECPRGIWECSIKRNILIPGNYYINYHIRDQFGLMDWVQNAVTFQVYEGDFFSTGRSTYTQLGGVFVEQLWTEIVDSN